MQRDSISIVLNITRLISLFHILQSQSTNCELKTYLKDRTSTLGSFLTRETSCNSLPLKWLRNCLHNGYIVTIKSLEKLNTLGLYSKFSYCFIFMRRGVGSTEAENTKSTLYGFLCHITLAISQRKSNEATSSVYPMVSPHLQLQLN